MKMDVSYTDHSYIIGRGGNNIKRIMEDTQTHIHFPDSNRLNPTEKSNQVSLCGSLEGVERARALVRLSTPLLISFELPVMPTGRPQPDHDTPYVKMVESKYNVQVSDCFSNLLFFSYTTMCPIIGHFLFTTQTTLGPCAGQRVRKGSCHGSGSHTAADKLLLR